MRFQISFLLVLTVAFFIITISSVLHPHRFHVTEYDVRVINGFTNNSSLPLVIWCTSEEIDLGGRALQEHDDFSWSIKTNIWGTTHISCTMKWDQRRKSFDAFQASKDTYRCSPLMKCSWLVKEDGFYFSNDEVNWKKEFSWPP